MRFKTLSLLALLLAVLMIAGPAVAQRGDDADRVSKNGAASGTIDGVDVSLEYGRPNVNGRDIWGGLVPYGQVWRTGANEATTITFGSDVTVEGEALPAGTYSLFTIPGADEWTVIFNKTAAQWGAYDYDEGEDALRVTVTPREHEMTESMDFAVSDGEVVMMWAELAVPIAVEAGS
jgi:hypothetical protein